MAQVGEWRGDKHGPFNTSIQTTQDETRRGFEVGIVPVQTMNSPQDNLLNRSDHLYRVIGTYNKEIIESVQNSTVS